MMTRLFFLLTLALSLAFCSRQKLTLEEFVRNEFRAFPESRFVDIYKSFFQDNYGPGHILNDTTLAGKYVDEDLANEVWPDTVLWQATGTRHNYIRMNLVLVKKGIIPRDTLLLAMLRSAPLAQKPPIADFRKEVDKLYLVVKAFKPDLADLEKDKKAIDDQLSKGEVMMHHSEHYLNIYQRRYRIVHRTVFDAWKNTFLKNSR
jgi:hypothetical protein